MKMDGQSLMIVVVESVLSGKNGLLGSKMQVIDKVIWNLIQIGSQIKQNNVRKTNNETTHERDCRLRDIAALPGYQFSPIGQPWFGNELRSASKCFIELS